MDEELVNIQSRMKADWDERVRHDYRYWMSDGVKSDEEMWETGSRDFEILTNGIPENIIRESKILDLGCGVGRILRAAAIESKEVYGVDVSEEAITKARRLLCDLNNVKFIQGNGSKLSSISDNEIDIAISFAALGSMPSIVMAGYLLELNRVLKNQGIIRLQVYLGKEQDISEEDTLALRSYEENRLFNAIEEAGFIIDYKQEVILPFEVSDYENGIIAYVIGAKKVEDSNKSLNEIHEKLISVKEEKAGEKWAGSRTAYLVALARAQQHIQANNVDEAEKAIMLAKVEYKGVSTEADELISKINKSRQSDRSSSLKILNEIDTPTLKFEQKIEKDLESINSALSVILTNDGEVLELDGVCLSHKTAPKKAAQNWANRALKSMRDTKDDILLIGLGDTHFANALSDICEKRIFVYETNKLLIEKFKNNLDKIVIVSSYDELEILINEKKSNNKFELVILPAAPFYLSNEIELVKKKINSRYLLTALNPRISVIGPLYGGSLPIAEYIQNAFLSMGLKSEYINLSSYYKSFTSFDKFLKKKDSRSILENKYVDLLSELVLQVVEERNTDILISVAQAPLSPKVLETCREKGIITVHWFMEDVNRFPTWKQIAKYYDYFFVIQKDSAIERIKDVGGKRVHYLPLACDPFIHKKIDISEEEKEIFGSTISFVGAGYNNRRYVFSKYARDDFKIWGTEWPDVVPFSHMVQRSGARVSVEDYTKVFNCSLININLHSSHEKNGVDPTGDFVNPRTFELAACKAFQLVDKRSLLSDLFNNDEIATFETENELREKIDYFSAKPEERNSYIEKSYKKVIEKHTYQQRIKSILEYVYADYGSHLSSRSKNDNWNRTLDAARPFSELCSMLEEVKERGDEPSIDALVAPLLNTKGVLDDTKKKLMFLHHMRGQISQINKLRNPNET